MWWSNFKNRKTVPPQTLSVDYGAIHKFKLNDEHDAIDAAVEECYFALFLFLENTSNLPHFKLVQY